MKSNVITIQDGKPEWFGTAAKHLTLILGTPPLNFCVTTFGARATECIRRLADIVCALDKHNAYAGWYGGLNICPGLTNRLVNDIQAMMQFLITSDLIYFAY